MTIGSRIRDLRRNLNYSQEYLAEQLEVSRQAVSKWEQDISNPDTNNIIKLAELLNSTVEYIASGKQETVDTNKAKQKLSKKQKIKIGIIISVCVLLIICGTLVGYIYTRPVAWDAGACGGGYATWIFDKYNKELTEVFLNGMGEEKENIISINSLRGTQSATWDENKIFLTFNIMYEHKDYGLVEEKVNFIGTRYWIDSFKWSGAIIVGE